MVANGDLSGLSMDFAVSALKLCDSIKGHYSLVDQLERSATSIGANIHEAQYAHSKADFIAKLEIALKESNETGYWLKLLKETGRITAEDCQNAEKLCGNIRRLLIASCRTAKGTQNDL